MLNLGKYLSTLVDDWYVWQATHLTAGCSESCGQLIKVGLFHRSRGDDADEGDKGDECDEAVMKVVMNLDVTTVVRKEIISTVACDSES